MGTASDPRAVKAVLVSWWLISAMGLHVRLMLLEDGWWRPLGVVCFLAGLPPYVVLVEAIAPYHSAHALRRRRERRAERLARSMIRDLRRRNR